MDETTKSELEKILHKFEDKAKERSKKDAQKNHEEERYRMEFPRVVKEVIRPTMEEIETFIKKQSHECHITESDAGIMMDIIPASMHRYAPDQPSIAFFNSPKSASIRMSKRPLQYTYVKSSIQEYIDLKIEDITRDLVEQNILDIMKTCENKTFK